MWSIKEPPSIFLDLHDTKFIKYMNFGALINEQFHVTK